MNKRRINISSGTKWEKIVGYSRAVRVGNMVEITGTVAVDEAGNAIGENNPYEQTRFILQKIEFYLEKAGAKLTDVVRTRIFVTDISKWEEIGKAHGEVFNQIRPVTSMLEVKALIESCYLVEIEATAILNKD